MSRIKHGYAGADWLRATLRHHARMTGTEYPRLSPLGETVADVLGYVDRGIYHIDTETLLRTDWTREDMIAVCVPFGRDLATWDGNALSQLVIICHDLMLRMCVTHGDERAHALGLEPSGHEWLRLRFWQRDKRAMSTEGCPTIEDHIAAVRAGYTIEG